MKIIQYKVSIKKIQYHSKWYYCTVLGSFNSLVHLILMDAVYTNQKSSKVQNIKFSNASLKQIKQIKSVISVALLHSEDLWWLCSTPFSYSMFWIVEYIVRLQMPFSHCYKQAPFSTVDLCVLAIHFTYCIERKGKELLMYCTRFEGMLYKICSPQKTNYFMRLTCKVIHIKFC